MKARIYHSISEFFRSINLELEQAFDFTIHPLDGLHGEAPMASPFFRTNYHTIVLIETGKGHYTIDGHWYPLKPFSYYFTNPGHLKSFTIEENVQGYMITFTEAFLRTNYPGNILADFPFLSDETAPVMYLPQAPFARLKILCEMLEQEYLGRSPYKEKILCSQLAGLLFKTRELLLAYQAALEPERRPAEIAQQFRAALNQNFMNIATKKDNRIWNVQDYAAHLHLHPNHLSNTIKAETGKTVKQWIDERVVSEACALLKNTSLTVAEVAYELAYEDASNFSRFFKKATGLTPGQFRKS
ncbi:MAG: helix-turn-helix domain-containing protein [Phaeodactylibacter sp.]|nr:helix-turn-helix domain-containing protein [Phaeodactylibacter sp.]MCB9274408.1 AraC family transcriptional regulator [Lewinellaceae bacterium]